MRKAHGPLWWYRLRYELPPWLLPALIFVAIGVCLRIEQIRVYFLATPVCRKVSDAPSGMQAGRLGPEGGRAWHWISRCRDGYVDVSGHRR